MKPDWAPATPAMSVAKARVELACPSGHDVLSVARIPFRHLAVSVTRTGLEPVSTSLRGSHPAVRRTGRVRKCAGQELNLHIPKAAALQAVRLANAQPTHVGFSSTGGSRTHRRS